MPIDDFPWIKERSECSLSKIFAMLRQQVSRDITIRESMRQPLFPEEANSRFSHTFTMTEDSDSFTVLLDGTDRLHERVVFVRGERSIKVMDTNGTTMFEATPSLNIEGKCVVKVKDKEYPLWYVRKMALEHLFFDIVPTN